MDEFRLNVTAIRVVLKNLGAFVYSAPFFKSHLTIRKNFLNLVDFGKLTKKLVFIKVFSNKVYLKSKQELRVS